MVSFEGVLWRGLLVVLTTALAACDGQSAASCFPGATQPCVCPGARIGAQSCGDDGHRWNACVCEGASGSDAGVTAPRDTGHDDDDDDDDDDDEHDGGVTTADVVEGDVATGPLLPADVTRGAAVFDRRCASCHGPTGTGTRNGPNIRSESTESSDRELAEIMVEGKDDMPPADVSPQDVVDVIAWMRATFGAYRRD